MAAQTFNIDTSHSSVGFSVRHMVVAKVHGRFNKWSASVAFDPENLAASKVEASIDASTIDTAEPNRDAHLKGADFFDVAKYPELKFVSRKVEGKPDHFKVTGDLSLHGVTREVTLDVESAALGKDPWGNERRAFSASTSINRGDFGLKWNQALEAGGVLVSEKVEINLELSAVAATAKAA